MITPQDSTILLAIAEASARGGSWSMMLQSLCEYLRADHATLYFADQGWTPEGAAEHPLPPALAGLRLGRVYTGEELAERLFALDDLPQAKDQRAIGIRSAHGAGWLILARARELFRASDSAALAALVPHLAHAFAMAAQVRAQTECAAQAEAVMRRLGIGALRWDKTDRIVSSDPVSQDILAALPAHAKLPSPEAGRPFHQITQGVELLVQTEMDGASKGLLRMNRQTLPSAELIAQALELTLAEARLARALGQGDNLREAAMRLNLTIETARYYSKQIFAKTGLRGQPDLIRRLWSGVLVLA